MATKRKNKKVQKSTSQLHMDALSVLKHTDNAAEESSHSIEENCIDINSENDLYYDTEEE